MEGLSRRRVPAGDALSAASNAGSNNSSSGGGSGSGKSNGNSASNLPGSSDALRNLSRTNTAVNNGSKRNPASTSPDIGSHRIAISDERDLPDSSQDQVPKLTLMEEVYLLGLKDRQGYVSFWNDNLSYTLRGCILIELALRNKIAIVQDPARRRLTLSERIVEVINDKPTNEVLLDEAIRLMKSSPEKISVKSWIDLMSGETWNVMKIGYQLKQVRERLAKGLVDKGVLRTEKKNFILFDMATHPVEDNTYKKELFARCFGILLSRTEALPAMPGLEKTKYPYTRVLSLICAAFSGAVLDNLLNSLPLDVQDNARQRTEDLLLTFSSWPIGGSSVAPSDAPLTIGEGTKRKQNQNAELIKLIRQEVESGKESFFEVIISVISVFEAPDSLG